MLKSNRFIVITLMAALTLGPAACTNMTKTEQGAVSGAAGGALVGATIGGIAQGWRGAGKGAAIGAVAGGVAGAIFGNTQEQKDQGYYHQPRRGGDETGYDNRGYRPAAQ